MGNVRAGVWAEMILAPFLGLTSTEIGQAGLAILVAVIGYMLHHKAHKIEVLVNGRFDKALKRIDQLEAAIRKNGNEVPPGTLTIGADGEDVHP